MNGHPHPISETKIEAAWQAINQSVIGGGLDRLMEAFGDRQPAILEFLSEGTAHWSEDAADLVFHAAMVIWTSFDSPSSPVEATALVQHYRYNLKWLGNQQGEAVLLQKKMADFTRFSEPHLMQYITEAVFEAHEDGLEIEPEEQQKIYLALKTIVDSLAVKAA